MRIRIVTEGASSGIWNAPSVTSLLATRHLPRFTGEEKTRRPSPHPQRGGGGAMRIRIVTEGASSDLKAPTPAW